MGSALLPFLTGAFAKRFGITTVRNVPRYDRQLISVLAALVLVVFLSTSVKITETLPLGRSFSINCLLYPLPSQTPLPQNVLGLWCVDGQGEQKDATLESGSGEARRRSTE